MPKRRRTLPALPAYPDGRGFAEGSQGPAGPQGPPGSDAAATTDAGALVTGTLPNGRFPSILPATAGVLAFGRGLVDGEWQNYTPVEDGQINALGNGALLGRYARHGKSTVVFWARILIGSTTTFLAVPTHPGFRLSLPVAAQGFTFLFPIQAALYDASSGNLYFGQGIIDSGSKVYGQLSSTHAVITKASPFAAAVNDQYVFGGVYEAA